jgi:ABC-type branched-subunit amino acid transport system ATPase component/ABC-type branched-subunit amino acid transport system permease subunit
MSADPAGLDASVGSKRPQAMRDRFERLVRTRTATGVEREVFGVGSPATTGLVIALVVIAIVVANYNGSYYETIFGTAAAYFVSAVGYNLLLGYAGQYAFAQAGFMAVGAYVFAVLELHGNDQWISALAGILAAGVFAGLVAAVVARTRDLYLALLTLACSQAVLVAINLIHGTGGANGIYAELEGENAYLVALVVAGVGLIAAQRLVRSRTGRSFNMVRSHERAAAAMGARVGIVRLTSFMVAGVLAGAGGVVLAGTLTYISPPNFTLNLTLLLLTVIVLGGLGSLWGTVLGIAFVTLVQQVIGYSATEQYVFFGVLFAVVALRPAGLASVVDLVSRPRGGSAAGDPPPARPPEPATASVARAEVAPPVQGEPGSLLRATGVSVSFGGVAALSDVDIEIPERGRVAIVGPNGAGKTTMLNAISGLVRVQSGTIEYDGAGDLCKLPPARRAKLGIARTFQDSALFTGGGMTVMDQLLCGAYTRERYMMGASLLRTPGMLRRERSMREEAMGLLEDLQLGHLSMRRTEELAGPDRRLVDLARALMIRPRLLLLDEIAAGMPAGEKERLASFLRDDCGQRMALVVIEHDLEFVRALADRVVVLTEGRLLADGPVEEVLDQADVMEAYIGVSA